MTSVLIFCIFISFRYISVGFHRKSGCIMYVKFVCAINIILLKLFFCYLLNVPVMRVYATDGVQATVLV